MAVILDVLQRLAEFLPHAAIISGPSEDTPRALRPPRATGHDKFDRWFTAGQSTTAHRGSRSAHLIIAG